MKIFDDDKKAARASNGYEADVAEFKEKLENNCEHIFETDNMFDLFNNTATCKYCNKTFKEISNE